MSASRDTDSGTPGEAFAERWSRLKQTARDEQAQSPLPQAPPQATHEDDTRVLTDADMPPLDTLDEHSDYAGFLSPGVSEQLRNQALRKLFRLPGMHLPDGLDDYDEDFTRFAELGDTVTREMRRMLQRELSAGDDATAADTPQQADSPAPREAQGGDAVQTATTPAAAAPGEAEQHAAASADEPPEPRDTGAG